ncbi:hypothetical protein CFB40_18445 [Burkholderia sp. AU31652]|nr:hypothetical protein CFB40_18445 [Burkholderia sp. AU31652]
MWKSWCSLQAARVRLLSLSQRDQDPVLERKCLVPEYPRRSHRAALGVAPSMDSMTATGPNGRRRSPSDTTRIQFNVNDRYNQSDQADSATLTLPNQSILRELARAARVLPTESDRLASLRDTFQLAVELFECEVLAAQWIELPHTELAGQKPLECLDPDQGHDRIRTLLIRAIHGVCA